MLCGRFGAAAQHREHADAHARQRRGDRPQFRGGWARFVEQPAGSAGLPLPRLRIEPSPYRSVLAPLLREVEALRLRCPGRPVIVVLSELAGGRWWEAVLHTRRTQRLRTQVLRHGGPDVSVLIVPWQLEAPETEQAIAEEEPQAT